MKKKQNVGISKEKLGAMTPTQRQLLQRDIQKERLEIVKEIELLLEDISQKKQGKPLHMQNPKALGRRPNDIREE